MKKLLLGLAASLVGVAFATDYTWTGNGGDGKWTTAENWSPSTGYPNTADDGVTIAGDATIALQDGESIVFKQATITSGTVTLTSEGTGKFVASHAWPDGFAVNSGATLKLSATVDVTSRFDVSGNGHCIVAGTVSGTSSCFFRALKMTFTKGANITHSSPIPMMGSMNQPYEFVFEDGAKVNASGSIQYCNGSSGTSPGTTVIEGDDTEIKCSGSLNLNYQTTGDNGQKSSFQTVTLKSGAITVGGGMQMWTKNLEPKEGATVGAEFVQEGGTLFVNGNLSMPYGSMTLKGGTASFDRIDHFDDRPNGDITVDGGDLTIVNDTIKRVIYLKSGVLRLKSLVSKWGTDGKIVVSGGKIVLSMSQGIDGLLDEGHLEVLPGAELSIEAADDVSAVQVSISKTRSLPSKLTLGSKVALFVDSGVDIVPNGTEIPQITVKDGAKFLLDSARARILVPIDLALEGAALFDFDTTGGYYSRDVVVARSYTIDGDPQPKGIYYAKADDSKKGIFVTQGLKSKTTQSMLAVPYLWTGAVGDGLWATGANWEGGVAPSTKSDWACFFGDVNEVTIAGAQKAWGVIYYPTEAGSALHLKGADASPSLTIGADSGYRSGMRCSKDSSLVFDLPTSFSGAEKIGFSGGGLFRFNAKTSNLFSNQQSSLMLDGRVELAGETPMSYMTYSPHHNLNIYPPIDGVHIVDGAAVTVTDYIHYDQTGFMGAYGFVQDGGTVTTPYLLTTITRTDNKGKNNYTLNGGDLNIATEMRLGGLLTGIWSAVSGTDKKVVPGGTFRMNGGTLTVPLISNEGYDGFCQLFGGDVYLGAGGFTKTTTTQRQGSAARASEAPIQLGAATLHAETASWSSAAELAILLDGDAEGAKRTVIDVAEGQTVTLNGAVSGPGGLVKRGAGGLVVAGAYAATGDITVEAGSLVFSGTLTGAPVIETAGGTVTLPAEVPAGLTLRAVAATDIVLAGDITVGRFVIGGVDRTGAVAVTGGTVTVSLADTFVWSAAASGNWSEGANWLGGEAPDADTAKVVFNAAAQAVTLDTAATVASLEVDGDLTISGSANLTFADGAVVRVPEGKVLTLATPVRAAGGIVKAGSGRIVFPTSLRSAADPSGLTWPAGTQLKVERGEAVVDCAVAGMRVFAESPREIVMPRVTVEENAVMTDRCALSGPWCGQYETGYGEVVMNGGRVDVRSGLAIFGSNGVKSGDTVREDKFALCYFSSGRMKFTLNGGSYTFATNNMALCFNLFNSNDDGGVVDLVINGGEMLIPGELYLGTQNAEVDTLTLNGGTLGLRNIAPGSGKGRKIVRLNGGTLVQMAKMEKAGNPYLGGIPQGIGPVEVNGAVNLVQTSAEQAFDVAVKLVGAGTFAQTGAVGTLVLREFDSTLTLGITRRGGLVKLDYDGTKEIGAIELDGVIGRPDRTYGAGLYRSACFAEDGAGALQPLTGLIPGALLLIR